MKYKLSLILLECLMLAGLAQAQNIYRIDPKQSTVKIHLSTSGLLRFLGDKHLIEAPVAHGTIRHSAGNLEKSSVELEIASKTLRVLDPELDAQKRQEVQKTMEGPKVLDVPRYPRIVFKSSGIRRMSGGGVELSGDLTVHGVTRKVTVLGTITSTRPRLQATGGCRFRQTDFGMKPVTAGAGTVRVKNEVQLTFRILAEPAR